jgi:hypothetical protein
MLAFLASSDISSAVFVSPATSAEPSKIAAAFASSLERVGLAHPVRKAIRTRILRRDTCILVAF